MIPFLFVFGLVLWFIGRRRERREQAQWQQFAPGLRPGTMMVWFGAPDQQVEIHTIPVPRGWSIEQSWEAISRGDLLTDPEPGWANVRIVDGRFDGVVA